MKHGQKNIKLCFEESITIYQSVRHNMLFSYHPTVIVQAHVLNDRQTQCSVICSKCNFFPQSSFYV